MLLVRRPVGRCRPTLLALALTAAFVPAWAQTSTEAAEEAEESEEAPTIVRDASVAVGAGLVDGSRADRAVFDQYSGLRPSQNLFGILDAEYYRRDDIKGTVVRFTAADLFTGNREMALRWARPGDWKFGARYWELTRREPLLVRSGLTGAGTATPQVNPVAPGTGSLLDLKTERTALGLTFSKVITSRLQFSGSASSERKEGSRLFGIGFTCPTPIAPGCRPGTGTETGSAVLLLPEPVDSEHHQIEARLAYAGDGWRLGGGYYGSFYRNAIGSLQPVVPGSLFNPVGTLLPLSTGLQGVLGQPVALWPDNQAHHFDLVGNYTLGTATHLNFKLARSIATQDDSFAGNGLTGAPAGIGSLDARMVTSLAHVGFSARPAPKWSLRGHVRYEDRDDRTPLALYNLEGTTRYTNRLYPYTSLRAKLQADYQLSSAWRASLGSEFVEIDRGTFTPTAAVSGITALRQETQDRTLRAELRRRMGSDFSGAITLEHGDRSGSNWLRDNSGVGVTEVFDTTVPDPVFASGIFMPNLADRTRRKVRLHGDWQPTEQLSLQVVAGMGEDRFSTPSAFGLRTAGTKELSLDANYALNEEWAVTGFVSRMLQELDQVRPDTAVLALRQRANHVGLGVTGKPNEKLELGAQLSYIQDRTTYAQRLLPTAHLANVTLLQATGGLPPTVFRQYVLKLSARYALDEKSSLRFEFAHHRTNWSDWAWDFNGTPFVYADGTTVTRDANQRVNVLRVAYIYRWQ